MVDWLKGQCCWWQSNLHQSRILKTAQLLKATKVLTAARQYETPVGFHGIHKIPSQGP